MNKHTKQLAQELEGSSAMPYFEIAVTREGEPSWISCEVFFKGNSLVAQREGVSTKEEDSKYIANNRIVVDSCLTLDEHLQDLHEAVRDSIRDGDLYTLAD